MSLLKKTRSEGWRRVRDTEIQIGSRTAFLEKRSQGLAIKLYCVREGCNTRQILSQSDSGVQEHMVRCEILDAFFVRPVILADMIYFQ